MRHPAPVRKTVLSSLLSLATPVLSLFLAVLALQGIIGCGSSNSPAAASIGVTIATPAASSVDPGDSVTLTATASNSSMGVTWMLSGTGCSGSACGTLSGSTTTTVVYTAPASPASSFMATITATSAGDTTKSATVNLTVAVAPSISTAAGALTGGTVGSAYSVTLAGAGGIAPYTWSLAAGSLPAGLSLGAGTGIISGTPAAAGSPSFTVKLTDSGSPALTSSTMYSIGIAAPPAIVFGAPMLPNGTVGTAYSGSVSATGGAGGLTYALASGALPEGLQLNTATGTITGTPTAAAVSTFTVKATDAYGDTGTSASYSITTANPALKITTSTLPAGTAGTAYSQTLAASGGAGGYTWSVTSGQSSLSAVGLSVSTAGVVSASSPTQGTATFTVKVTDSASNTATQMLSVTINGALSITTANTLPSGTVNTAYSQTFAAAGGSGTGYTWSVTSGQSSLTALGLSFSTGGVLSGSGPAFGTATFGVKVTDSANNTATGTFSVTINYATLSISTKNIQSATVNQAYSQGFAATGGSGNYTWSVTSGLSGLSGDGLSFSTGGTLSGTPTANGSLPFTVQVKDTTTNNTASQTYTLTVNAAATTYTVSGTVYSAANCGGTVQGATVSINTSPAIATTTDANGNFTLNGVAAGNWTITPSYAGATAAFFPATQAVTVSGITTGQNFGALVTFTVSGTVSYSGAKTGTVYLAANSTNCGGNGAAGTSISAPGAYTIHGVGAPGTYTVQAFMDAVGQGAANATDPTGSASVTTGYANSTGVNITLADPGTVTLSSAPQIKEVAPFNTGALVMYKPIENGNGEEMATSYMVQWSTSSSFTTVAGSQTFPAIGTNTTVFFLHGLTNGTPYYFHIAGVAGSSTSPYSSVDGPVTIGAPTSGDTVSGSVTFPGTATGPLYVAMFSPSTNGLYAQYIASPSSPQAFTIQAPSGSYQLVAVLDQNNDGIADAGDVQDLTGSSGNPGVALTIGGNTTSEDLTLSGSGSVASVATVATNAAGNTFPNTYSLNFSVNQLDKLPVKVQLASGPNVATPTDVALCLASNCGKGFQIGLNTFTTSPVAGDTYTFNVTYSDGTTGTLTAQVSAVLSAFATNLSPTTGIGTSTQPTFSWTDPANAAGYTYNFVLNSPAGMIWSIPGNNSNTTGNNSNTNGFSSTITSIPWNTDPSGNDSLPSVSSLSTGTVYTWQINVIDSNNNQAITQVQYQP
jgi:large repetitive protein